MFEVGDIITGKPFNGYGLTNEEAIMKVIKIYRETYDYPEMRVKIIEHKIYDGQIGAEHVVENNKERFKLINNKK